MRLNILFFLISLSLLCLTLAQLSYDDCCLKYVRKMTRNTQKHAVQYRRQEMDGGCNIPAIIFTMRKGRKFCTDPKEDWVVKLMRKIDAKITAKVHHNQWPNRG